MMFFIEGLLLGYAYAMPIGPQNLFVINSAIKNRRGQAIATAGIVGVMDVTLAFACFYGVGIFIQNSEILKNIMLGVGTLFLAWLAIKLISSKESATAERPFARSWQILSVVQLCFVLTWLNPQALIDGSLLLGGYSAQLAGRSPSLFLAGITTASFSWFLFLTFLVSSFKEKLSRNFIRKINIGCGVIMLLFAIRMGFEFFIGVIR